MVNLLDRVSYSTGDKEVTTGVHSFKVYSLRTWLIEVSKLKSTVGLDRVQAVSFGLGGVAVDIVRYGGRSTVLTDCILGVYSILSHITSDILLDNYYVDLTGDSLYCVDTESIVLNLKSLNSLFLDICLDINPTLCSVDILHDGVFTSVFISNNNTELLQELNKADFMFILQLDVANYISKVFCTTLKQMLTKKRITKKSLKTYFRISDSEVLQLLKGEYIPAKAKMLSFAYRYKLDFSLISDINGVFLSSMDILDILDLLGRVAKQSTKVSCLELLQVVTYLCLHSDNEAYVAEYLKGKCNLDPSQLTEILGLLASLK